MRSARRSFRITWGVDTMILSSLQRSSRSSGAVASPVKSVIRSTARTFRIEAACCSTSGFVGARKRIRPPRRRRTSAMTMAAMTVLPIPVGRTTRVDRSRHARAMFTWYARSSTVSRRRSSCVTDTAGEQGRRRRTLRSEGRHDRVLAVALVLLPDRDDPVEPRAAAFREADGLHVRHGTRDRLVDHGFAGHSHEHEVLVEAADDDVEDRTVAVVDPVDDEHRFFADAIVRADRIDERALVVNLVDEAALEDVLGFRGHREAALDPNRVDRLAQARLREGGRDPTFINAVLDGRPAAEEVPRIESDADGDLHLATGLHRLVVAVTQMTGDAAARPSIGAQDQDAVERQVAHALPFGDPYAGGDVATRVLREQLRDRELP